MNDFGGIVMENIQFVKPCYKEYYDRLTNFQGSYRLKSRLESKKKADYLIGLNIIHSSFHMINEDIKNKKETNDSLRLAQAVNISVGLEKIIDNVLNKKTNPNEIIDFLKVNIGYLAKTIKDIKINTSDISSNMLYEFCASFYYHGGNAYELGKRMYTSIISDSKILKLISELETIEGRIHKNENDNPNYETLIGMADGVKARIFNQEEYILRYKMIGLLGFDF